MERGVSCLPPMLGMLRRHPHKMNSIKGLLQVIMWCLQQSHVLDITVFNRLHEKTFKENEFQTIINNERGETTIIFQCKGEFFNHVRNLYH